MQLSQRLRGINGGGSDGWDVFLKARKMIAAGEDVTELTIGEHDIGTAAPVLREMYDTALAGNTGYAAVPGIEALREAVAARVSARTGVPTTSANVLITPGGQSALYSAHIAALDAGDTGLIIDPFYATYPYTVRAAGATPVSIGARAADAFQPRAEAIAARAPGAKSLLINSPNNPTGVVYSRTTLEGIAQVCTDHDLWLISDEVYDTQVWEGAHISPRSLPGMAERTLVVGSLSKSHAMTGSRCGWLVGPEEAITDLISLATNITYGVPGFIQLAGLFALRQGEAFEAEISEPFRRRRQLAHDVLAGQNAVAMVPAQGAMYLMLDVRATGLSGEGFANDLLDTHRIAVMPGESFGEAASGHIRVAMTVADDVFVTALRRLCAHAETLAAA
ncbi:pyridoxal phosphate-dependent aminotransferase [Roseobacter ponti]|uniref:aspartate transaminase n=1 Tax=Roseobacter ponti TaxID=1891787 RepID=A0A858SQK0_9RHOB|nr:aminotransferase class I/II-fold pyridoxal phosphate-dependent enzyme [Roseobacter ponti]QJF50945.1 aminotransferase class I/II-fold pyridoxal phosphate-dependent enzyme [Roseobacter ponti]